jgi:type VI protein secretion system component VasF
MAQPERRERARQAAPVDPNAVARAYRLERAKRRVRERRVRERKLARLRFLLVLVLLTSAFLFLSLGVWNQIERLFGL